MGFRELMAARGARGPFPSPRGGGLAGPAGPRGFGARPGGFMASRPASGVLGGIGGAMRGAMPFAEGGEVKDPEEHEAEQEVTPELKLAAYELLECLDNHSYADDKGGRAEALAKHLLAFFHLAEEMPHEEGPHVEHEDEESEYDDGDEE